MASHGQSPLKTRLLLAGLRSASHITGWLPRRSVGWAICRLVGLVWFASSGSARDAVRDNLRHMLGHEPSTAQLIAVFQNGALNYWDTFAIPHFSARRVLDEVDIHGGERLARALTAGRGVIVCTAHLGSVSFVGQIIPALGFAVTGVLEALDPPEVSNYFSDLRSALGARMLPLTTGAIRELVLALRHNEFLGLVTDRDVTGRGVLVDFFDAQTMFPDGAATLALRSGAPILLAVCSRKPDRRFDAWISDLPLPDSTGDRREDVRRVTQAIARGLEYYIASYPEQWTVFQKRWPPRTAAVREPRDAAR